jgi:hypothetical protein
MGFGWLHAQLDLNLMAGLPLVPTSDALVLPVVVALLIVFAMVQDALADPTMVLLVLVLAPVLALALMVIAQIVQMEILLGPLLIVRTRLIHSVHRLHRLRRPRATLTRRMTTTTIALAPTLTGI